MLIEIPEDLVKNVEEISGIINLKKEEIYTEALKNYLNNINVSYYLKQKENSCDQEALQPKDISNYSRIEEKISGIQVDRDILDWGEWIGLDGTLLWVNPSVEKITGYTSDEYIRMDNRYQKLVFEEDQSIIFSHIEKGLKEKISEDNIDFRIRRKDNLFR